MPANFATNYSLTLHTKNTMKKENVTKTQILPELFVSVEINTKICQIIKITGVQSMEILQDRYVKHVEHLPTSEWLSKT